MLIIGVFYRMEQSIKTEISIIGFWKTGNYRRMNYLCGFGVIGAGQDICG